jgi:hypothetical protein
MEMIIDKQRELNVNLGRAVYEAIKNLQYFINNQDSISQMWIEKKFPKHERKERYYRKWTIEDYSLFKDIDSLQNVVKSLAELNSIENKRDFMSFTRYKYDLIKLATLYELKQLTYLEEILITKSGFERRYSKINVDEYITYSQEEMLIKKKEQLDAFSYWIIDAIELLYICLRYCDEMNSLLNINSDKMGRMLRMFTGKE